MILVAAYGGLRWGELAGLRRRRVNLDEGTIVVAEQLLEVRGAFTFGPVKTRAGNRTVTLPAVAAIALDAHMRRWTKPGPDALVFLGPRGTYLRRSNFHRRVWLPATKKAGVPKLRFHDLRHTAGTLATVAGATLREVMERLGHSSTAAAIRYQHVLTDRDAAVVRSLDRLITSGNGTHVARGAQNASLETQEAGREDPA